MTGQIRSSDCLIPWLSLVLLAVISRTSILQLVPSFCLRQQFALLKRFIVHYPNDRLIMDTNEYIAYLKEFSLITSEEAAKTLKVFCIKGQTEKLSSSITEKLQMFDIVTQRLQHLVDTHEKVMTLYIADIFKKSFLHLQYFQFSIIAFDLFEILSFINTHLKTFTESCDIGQPNKTTEKSKNTERLTALIEKIKRILKDNAGDAQFVKMPALTKRQINICRQLYTMERERFVLDWYVNNSTGELHELLDLYQTWLTDYNNPSMELFDNI
jgi:hypothetical protein